MHSTTPSGERRICPKTPCSMTKRDDCRSRSFTACTVSRTYSTVRSNSFSASPFGLPISHMRSFTTSARSGFSFARNVSTAFRRSAMVARGHAPRPRSYARFAAAKAAIASASPSAGTRPSTGRVTRSPSRTHTAASMAILSPAHVRTWPSHSQRFSYADASTRSSAGSSSAVGKQMGAGMADPRKRRATTGVM